MPGLDREIQREIAWRVATSPDWEKWSQQLADVRYCHRPVHLVNSGGKSSDGDVSEPATHVLKACGNRREAICPPCSRTYKGDLWQLVMAGLRGGKGVPDSISASPVVFATFTAPSFGAVHQNTGKTGDKYCQPRRDAGVCEHGEKTACWARHDDDDSCVGEPICAECFDYENAVIWNALAPELWRRTTIYVRRALAAELEITAAIFKNSFRVSFFKVAEYQRRGLLHFHAIVRLDALLPFPVVTKRPSAQLLCSAIERAAGSVSVPSQATDLLAIKWGGAIDVSPLTKTDRERAAAYIAKYATKSTEVVGGLTSRVFNSESIESLPVSDHVRRFLFASAKLAERPELSDLRLLRAAHQMGFHGHWSTKSHTYSTTLAALREARQRHVAGGAETNSTEWVFGGAGHSTRADLVICESHAAEADRVRKVARIEVRSKGSR